MRILVVEDELQLARHLTRALYRNGHEATAVHDGEAGVRAAMWRAGSKGIVRPRVDYLPKPFAMDELLVRIEALGRRAGVPSATNCSSP